MIEAVGVVIPARDERERIEACMRSVRAAVSPVPVVVCVVADRCTDDTADLARAAMPAAHVLGNEADLSLGEVRGLGARHVLTKLSHVDSRRIWLLSTDADSVVGPDWVTGHLRHANTGVDGVAGTVRLSDTGRLGSTALRRYQRHVGAGMRPSDHDHVYGANLGVRASAYAAIGGYRPIDTGEDRDLWCRLHAAGLPTASPLDPVVRTSSRLLGRARGGLADLLVRMTQGVS